MRKYFGLLLKLALVGCAVLIFYVIYLDSVVTKRFTEARYEAPALLYSRALELRPDYGIRRDEVVRELGALDYRETRYARNPGEFQQQGTQLLLFRRAFDFPDRYEHGQRVRLTFDQQGMLSDLVAWPSQEPVDAIRLEPQLIGRFASDNNEDRLLVGLEQVPVLMQQTLLLVEDREFYHHRGVRPSSILRAAVANIRAGRTVQGGSTITQQLVKNMFLTMDQHLTRKINEAIMALSLDYRFSKDEILEAYFNEVFFGQDRGHAIHGVGLGSQFYFGKAPEDLTPPEIAQLIGMIRGPSLYNPYRNPERAQDRRDFVLRLMYSHDLISQTQYLAALEAPVVTRQNYRLVAHSRPDYVDLVQQELRRLIPGRAWQETGLRVFTYFDPYLQAQAQHGMTQRMQEFPDQDMQTAVVISDYRDGTVRALIGGRTPVNAGFNRAFQARRQIGSLMKPLVYTLALEDSQRYSLGSILYDEPLSMRNERGQLWEPKNFDDEFLGPVSLLKSWVDSRNIPAIQVAQEIEPTRLRDHLYGLGMTGSIHAFPSLALGTIELSPLQVNHLYSYIANHGVAYAPTTIAGITTHRGDHLYVREPRAITGFSPEAAYLARYASHGVVQEGTGRSMHRIMGPEATGVGGKTGSTNDLRDSWFVSFDERYVMTTWMGRDDNQPIGLTGSRGALITAATIWRETGVVPLNLSMPEGVAMGHWNKFTGTLVAPGCNDTVQLPGIGVNDRELTPCRDVDPEQDATPEDRERRPWWRRVFGD
ncbi:penicillin-binding protein 1B [Aliidiomarina halalkaliphila]|uniref:Penicillin-binding protein 1B n=1 Tax=Aliidiomarina halalkaliphila TaxID=2593535 RepID=A0A552WZQ0_9GAMM|nr:penicillin-binding protein 1B [Aliidiomarina halalkaliphila]TRW48165.1 penicillin-binding protein 1B [Aliidiomarina halalkaliphila]